MISVSEIRVAADVIFFDRLGMALLTELADFGNGH